MSKIEECKVRQVLECKPMPQVAFPISKSVET